MKRKETSIAFLAEITGAVFDRTLCVALIATWFPKLTLAFPNSFAGIAGLDAYLARDFACTVQIAVQIAVLITVQIAVLIAVLIVVLIAVLIAVLISVLSW